ncbi:MAG: hypothetical protein ACMG6E_05850 [Candidatus Roizmanbacteria bacterium]
MMEESSFEEAPIALKESLSNTEAFEEEPTTLECVQVEEQVLKEEEPIVSEELSLPQA